MVKVRPYANRLVELVGGYVSLVKGIQTEWLDDYVNDWPDVLGHSTS